MVMTKPTYLPKRRTLIVLMYEWYLSSRVHLTAKYQDLLSFCFILKSIAKKSTEVLEQPTRLSFSRNGCTWSLPDVLERRVTKVWKISNLLRGLDYIYVLSEEKIK